MDYDGCCGLQVTRLTRADDISGREDSHITDSISHSHSSVPTATDSCAGPKPQSTVTGAGTGSQSELTLLRRIINSFEEQGNHGLVCDFRIKNQAVKVPAATSSCEDHGKQSVGGNPTADSEAEMTAARTATNNEQGNQRTVIKVETNHHGDVGVAGPGDQEGVCTDSQAVLAVFPTELSCIAGGKQDKYHTSVIMTGSKDCGGEGTQPHSQQVRTDSLIIIIIIIIVIIIMMMMMIIIVIMVITIIIIVELKGAIQDFLRSPHCTVNCLQHVCWSGPGHSRVQITCNRWSAHHVEHCPVPLGVKGHFDRV